MAFQFLFRLLLIHPWFVAMGVFACQNDSLELNESKLGILPVELLLCHGEFSHIELKKLKVLLSPPALKKLINESSSNHLIKHSGKDFISVNQVNTKTKLGLFLNSFTALLGARNPPRTFKGIPVWATTFEPQIIASRGPHGDFNMRKGDMGAALPSRKYLGKELFVFHPQTGRSTLVKVIDVGPWNTKDLWLEEGRRPKSESGTDLRGRKTNYAGLDLSSEVWVQLGIPRKKAESYKYSSYVEFLLLD